MLNPTLRLPSKTVNAVPSAIRVGTAAKEFCSEVQDALMVAMLARGIG